MRLTVEVTQSDIFCGVRGDCDRCPWKRALRRAAREHFGGDKCKVWVDESFMTVTHDGNQWKTKTPEKVAEFIRLFDSGGSPLPLTLKLNLFNVNKRRRANVGDTKQATKRALTGIAKRKAEGKG